MEYKEDGRNWLLLTTLVALTLIILFSEMLKFSKKKIPYREFAKENMVFWRIF
jgi:hypothetical protein